jgi:hypothetical protein
VEPQAAPQWSSHAAMIVLVVNDQGNGQSQCLREWHLQQQPRATVAVIKLASAHLTVSGRPNSDLADLMLLCQWHHTVVHEGGVSITRDADRWVFHKPDEQPCDWWVDDQNLARHLDFALRRQTYDQLAAVDSFQHPDAQTIRPRWNGEPFYLHGSVQALFTIKPSKQTTELDQQAA